MREKMMNSEATIPLSKAIETWRKELGANLEEMQKFETMGLENILRRISAYSARATYIRSKLVRSKNPEANSFRTQEVDYFLTEVDRQFKVWSRFAAVLEMEMKLV
jgi:hypothetical protein